MYVGTYLNLVIKWLVHRAKEAYFPESHEVRKGLEAATGGQSGDDAYKVRASELAFYSRYYTSCRFCSPAEKPMKQSSPNAKPKMKTSLDAQDERLNPSLPC